MTSKRKAATAKERVLASYPEADNAPYLGPWAVYSNHAAGAECIGRGRTAGEAWADAASRLKTKTRKETKR